MGAHGCRALHDRLFERAARAIVDVFLGEGAFGGRNLGDGFLQRAMLRAATVENARLVEVNVGLHKTGKHQPATKVFNGAVGRDRRLNCGDAAVANRNIHLAAGLAGE